jgi:threonine dehydratase
VQADALDVGKILAGIQVPPGAEQAFDAFLEELGYPFVEETQNPAYQNFMCAQ